MTDFVIDPPIRILGRRGSFVRSTREAAAFMRKHMDNNAPSAPLESAKSTKEAQEAAKAFRSWIANSNHFLPNSGKSKNTPVTCPPGREKLLIRPLVIGSDSMSSATIGMVVLAAPARWLD
jgi:hypothetical protein